MPPTLLTAALRPLLTAPDAPPAPDESVVEEVGDVVGPVLAVAAGVVAAYVLAMLVGVLVRRLARRSAVAADLTRRSRRPTRAVLLVIGVWVALRLSTDPAPWRVVVEHVLLILLIVAVAWLIGSLAFVLEDAALARYRIDVEDNRRARRVRTQVQLLRRITVAVLVVCAIAAILLTFPSARTFGASLLASAGLLSIVAGLAAQSSLANLFAGMQLAFTDAIRVDDVVVVDGEWGRIEEITLTYVVVHVWDDRRLILPSTHFTTTPFENWTRRQADLLGTVELDLDWEVPVDAMRAELTRLLEATDLWDGRVGILQVTDAVGGAVRVRVLASARDAPTLFDLRCYVREGLVGWLQREAPEGLPRTRWEGRGPVAEVPARRGDERSDGRARSDDRLRPDEPAADEGAPRTRRERARDTVEDTLLMPPAAQDARLFTGSIEALERSRSFQGPGQDVFDEREQHADETDPGTRG
ncbi:mechanosensitive ion channel family protein [Cellulomonas fimi]|uniref:mechanosensitive ion channel family protein n=1 Tax=Cellulomonas fimi TaxID=1708 RepID=UPI00234D09E7|nr:mechanosensitive ion channel family protein [Cellulomonas fimi]MDC7122016.1 mechanosensitive ion channel family protein [Cellulomonas fimi]